ncbi:MULTISPECIES: hypothetical protein [Micromonospora]|uniref:hypothetical protein n=1 Tax=Micromonospora TaxID=1873 RepID=UPI001EE8AA47|nr:hypothetical protein [Micromonospora hortensis]MCG5448063.1 hypothetical protein [Micromonospora hortensis]WTI06724.1 hypothetical protein OHB44_25415 [Micromonospora sp. NBC_00821]
MADRPPGHWATVADLDASSVVDFRYSPRRHRRAKVVAVLGAAALLAAYAALFDEPWWQAPLRFGWIGAVVALVLNWQLRRQPRLPLRLTDETLHLTGPNGTGLSIDWVNMTSAQVRGRLDPRLVVTPRDPEQTRPPMRPGQWSTPGRGPYELVVRLNWMTPGPDTLRRELARRLPTT